MAVKCSSRTHTCVMVVRVENITRGGKMQHRESLRCQKFPGGGMPPDPLKWCAVARYSSSEIDSDAIWANLGGKNRNHISFLFYDKELQLAKITC